MSYTNVTPASEHTVDLRQVAAELSTLGYPAKYFLGARYMVCSLPGKYPLRIEIAMLDTGRWRILPAGRFLTRHSQAKTVKGLVKAIVANLEFWKAARY